MRRRVASALAALIAAVIISPTVLAVPLKEAKSEDLASVLKYFIKFGHTDSAVLRNNDKNEAIQELENDLKEFQKFAGLNQTGELDEATKRKFQEPRCGIKDNAGRRSISKTGRRKRYYLHGSRWRVRRLTYRIENAPQSAPEQQHVDSVLKDALNTWAREADINFVPARDDEKAHIVIKFAQGRHGDADPFDGPGGTLAHAYFPLYGGDAHFDDTESWSINSKMGSNLYVASTHEFGHSLGLSHSDVRSMMSPWYQRPADPFSRDLLADDDRRAIQQLYGRRDPDDPGPPPADPGPEIRPQAGRGRGRGGGGSGFDIFSIFGRGAPRRSRPSYPGSGGPSPGYPGSGYPGTGYPGAGYPGAGYPNTGYPGYGNQYPGYRPIFPSNPGYIPFGFMKDKKKKYETKVGGDPELCASGEIDAALSVGNETFVFRGARYWRLTEHGVAVGYPRNISGAWRGGLHGPLSAAVHLPDQKRFYMFSGKKVWAYSDETYDALDGYPRAIQDQFPGTTDGPLSAAFVWNDTLHLVQGGRYWTLAGGGAAAAGGPRRLADTRGMPVAVSAGTRYATGATFLFSGDQYYRLDKNAFQVDDSGKTPYPRKTGLFWFGCSADS